MVSDYRLVYALVGLISIWGAFILFEIGFLSVKQYSHNKSDNHPQISNSFPLASIQEWTLLSKTVSVIIAWGCTIFAARFYTGRNFTSVISGIRGGVSAYQNYQRYFVSNNIASFTLAKIPYILMLAILTILLMWTVLSTILCKSKRKWYDYMWLISIILAYLYFGSARGTNFETYIVFILLSYCFLQKSNGMSIRKKVLAILAVGLIGLVMIFSYRYVLLDRGVIFENKICQEISFDAEAWISRSFPSLTNIYVSLFSYLGYGIYAIGVSVVDICFGNVKDIIGFLLPMGHRLMTGETMRYSLSQTINIGVRWIPDYVQLIDLIGGIGIIVFFLLLGRFTSKIQRANYPALLKEVLHAIVFIEMLSVPIGNFLLNSSSNEIMVLYAILWMIQNNYFVIKIKR